MTRLSTAIALSPVRSSVLAWSVLAWSVLAWSVLTWGFLAWRGPAAAAAQDFDRAGEQLMLARINEMRTAQGVAPLSRHPGLDAAARAHTSDMAAQQTLTHVSESSGTPADRVRAVGATASTVTENVALHRSAREAHEALLTSDAHRQNMLSADVTHVGLAALPTEHGVYVTQVFANIEASEEASQPEEVPPEATQRPVIAPQILAPSVPTPAVEVVPEPAPPAAEVEDMEAEVEAPPVASGPSPAQGRAPQGPVSISPGSGGMVVLQHTPDRSRVQGYWVYGSGRWWYYPMPSGAQPGQRLQPDRSVQGPPPGMPVHPGGQVYAAPPSPVQSHVRPTLPLPSGQVVLSPHRGVALTVLSDSTEFYAVPPPPMVGQPTRAWRRAHRAWERAHRRWLRQQARARRAP